jgi:hypothetical protein
VSKRSGPDIPIARINFWTVIGGTHLLVHAGEAWEPDDPIVTANPGKFQPLRIHSSHSYPSTDDVPEQPAAPEPTPVDEPSEPPATPEAATPEPEPDPVPAAPAPVASAPKAASGRGGRRKTAVTA